MFSEILPLLAKILPFLINYIIPFLILLTVIVFIHEYGHYYFAKKYGVGVKVFSIGMGKELFGWTDKSGTRWRFSAIPIGGYVKFFGDHSIFSDYNREELRKKYTEKEQEELLAFKPLYQRNLIAFGGPFANFILAFFIFVSVFVFIGKDFTPALISEVQKDSPAEFYGLKKNDVILSINDKKINSIIDVSRFIMTSNSEFIKFNVLRNNEEQTKKVKPNLIDSTDDFGNPIKRRIVGITLMPNNNQINHVKLNPVKASYYAIKEIYFFIAVTLDFVWGFVQKIWGKGYGDINQLGGPIKIAQVSGTVFQLGFLPFIMTLAYISLSLGLVNLFPIPLLDGGHIFLNTLEALNGKEFNRKTIDYSFRIGIAIIATLIVFTTLNDIRIVFN